MQTDVTAPQLETERLILRAHAPADLAACAAMWANPEVVRSITGVPSSVQQTWSRMLSYAGLWRFLGYGYWAIVEAHSGAFVGDIGFGDFKREMTPSIAGLPEAGWVLAPAMHGKGYAVEALRAVLRWSDAHVASRIACIITPGNTPSIRLAQTCGFVDAGTADYRGPVTLFFRERHPYGNDFLGR